MGERERVQLLLWRAGMGATPAQVDAALATGYTQAVETVLAATDAPTPPPLPAWPAPLPPNATPEQKTQYNQAVSAANSQGLTMLTQWWVNLLRTSAAPLQEHLALFFHNHFSTSNDKVARPPYMLMQNQLFRTLGRGKFVDLLIAVAKDPAMLIWLDGRTNVKGRANENFAREAMELFTLGIGNYTETDVREAARACTGWTLSETGEVKFDPKRFDSGTKTILGQTGTFNLDDFCRLIVGRPEATRYVSGELFKWFAGDTPSDGDLAPMVAAWNQTGGEIRAVLRALFTSDAFSPERATTAHIKNPALWTIGILRGLGVTATDQNVTSYLNQQGMTLFRPPNVGGWPSGPGWISPANQLLRYNIAGQMIAGSSVFAGKATAAYVQQLADKLGGLAIPADVQAQLVSFGNGTDGQRAVAQVVLGGPDYQAW